MVRVYYTHWKQNQQIKLNQNTMGKAFKALVWSLATNKSYKSTYREPSQIPEEVNLSLRLHVPPANAPTQKNYLQQGLLSRKNESVPYGHFVKNLLIRVGVGEKSPAKNQMKFSETQLCSLEKKTH